MSTWLTDDDEWTVDAFIAECERVTANPPPAPKGLELLECGATPRHWPTYVAHIDGQYPGHCYDCAIDNLDRANRRLVCERDHRRWKSWSALWWITTRLYALGITSTGASVRYGRCEFCGVGRQHSLPRWRGRRPYILGKSRYWWTCLRHGHRHSPTDYGLCSVCAPCPSCGSTEPTHPGDCDGDTP